MNDHAPRPETTGKIAIDTIRGDRTPGPQEAARIARGLVNAYAERVRWVVVAVASVVTAAVGIGAWWYQQQQVAATVEHHGEAIDALRDDVRDLGYLMCRGLGLPLDECPRPGRR